MIIVNEQETLELLTSRECIGVMKDALLCLSKGESVQYLRTAINLPGNKILGFMPCYLNDRYFGAKVISVFPGNVGTGYPSHMGQVMLFDSVHGEILAMVDGTAITKVRTGAVSAVATDALARKDAKSIAFLGAGVQARSHYAAISCVREIKQVYIYDINMQYAQAFARELSEKEGLDVKAFASAAEAAADADIICTLTHSHEPLIYLKDLKPGVHINAVGACAAKDRELASDITAKARFFGDRKESVFAESGDFLFPLHEGLISNDHYLGDIGDVLCEKLKGRLCDDDITVFEALGLAVEDLSAARFVYEKKLQ